MEMLRPSKGGSASETPQPTVRLWGCWHGGGGGGVGPVCSATCSAASPQCYLSLSAFLGC